MKLLQCGKCLSIKMMIGYKPVSCECGLCHGRYTDPFKTGKAIFSELNAKKPKYLWVIGIVNDFLSGEPYYGAWKYPKTSMNYKMKSNIVRIRPTKLKFYQMTDANCTFVSYKKFITLI